MLVSPALSRGDAANQDEVSSARRTRRIPPERLCHGKRATCDRQSSIGGTGRMSAIRKFARFYYPEFQRDYPDIYSDDAAFSAWMRLLVIAEQSWPAVPELPRSIRPKALRVLTAARERGPLVAVHGHSFAIKGFAAERSRRHDAALAGALAKHGATAGADAPPNGRANGGASVVPSTKTSTKNENEGLNNAVDVGRRPPASGPVEPLRRAG